MTVDITQDEMNILNLNGISAETVRANVEYLRATGMDDAAIRQQFTNTIGELKPITKVSANDAGKIKEWQDKGAITPFEMAQRKSMVFDGTYHNIDDSANLSAIEKKMKNSAYNSVVEQRIQAAQNKKAERNKRVNEGTASFLDRAGAALDRMGEASYQAQVNAPDDLVLRMSGVNKPKEVQTGKIGFSEGLGNSFMTGSWLPFVGGFVGSADTKKERQIAENIRNGKPIRQDELDFINHRTEQRQEERVRGYSVGGHIGQTFLPALIRFGGEIATGQFVLRGLGLASELPAGASLGQKTLHGLGEMAKTGAVNTLLPTGWNETFDHYQSRMLDNEIQFTDKGEVIFKESDEKPSTAFLKSLGQTFVMFASEAAGELIGIPVKGAAAAVNKYAGTPIGNYLKSNKVLTEFVKKITPELSKIYEKMNGLPIKGQSMDWLKNQVKFDGFIEEIGEEVLEDVLNLTIGTHNEERTLENYAKAIFKSPDEWAIIAGAVALQGGTLSVASHLLGGHLEQNGATDEQIVEVLQNLSENEKEEMVHKLIEEGSLNIDETEEQHFEKTISTVSESLLQSGRFTDKEKADKAARLGATMLETMSKKLNKSFDELVQDDMVEMSESEEAAYTDGTQKLYGSVEYSQQSLSDRINFLLDEYSNLPEDFDDTVELDRRIQEIDLLSKVQSNDLTLEEIERTNDMISELEEKGDSEFAQVLRNSLNSENKTVHFQRADFAGAEKDELIRAAKEWKEKGTESEYFKNWLENTTYVDETKTSEYNFNDSKGVTVKVYHGSASHNIEIFDNDKSNYGAISKQFNFFTNKKSAYPNSAQDYAGKDGRVYECFVKMKNPLVFTFSNKYSEKYYDAVHYWDYNAGELRRTYNKANMRGENYDGIIVYNSDKTDDDSVLFLVENPEQIKSAENIGTFDSTNPNIYFQSAYHGTPHRFDEFSTENIGTGEGAQAHGWGLYFAENKEVSEEYRRKLSGNKIVYDGKELEHKYHTWAYDNGYNREEQELYYVLNRINEIKNEEKLTLEQAKDKFIKNYESRNKLLTFMKKHLEIAKGLDISKIDFRQGQLFEVDVPENDVLLDEDLLLDEQPEKVQKSIEKLLEENSWIQNRIDNALDNVNGKMFYSIIAREDGAKEASLLLNEYGIKGITYDGQRDGRCYVVFDDKAVKVLQKYYQKSPRQNKIFLDNERAEQILNRFEKIKGTFIPAENLITLFKDADESTIVHEFAHWWLDKLVKYAGESEELQEDLNAIRKFVKNQGEPFTNDQHERFARGFEVYMRTGSAKTNRLKKLFEDFKNALLSLYDSIKNLGFKDEEIPEINNLFERLLTTENQRIQSAVFGKCNQIQEQIQQIRDNQEKEFADIDAIERDNIEKNLRDSQRSKQVKEYLRLAEKAVSRVPKSVREYEERYKQATYEILEVATGYKRQFIANPKNWEIIQEKIGGLDDQITVNDGMQANWREFYSDTGVSYENDEIDGDYKLAEKAFQVLASGNFKPLGMEEEEIGRFFGMFDYLAGKVDSLRGENKDAAYEALSSLFNKIPTMPDEAVREMVEKYSQVGEKFIDQKATERMNGRAIPNVSLPIQFKVYVADKMHNMKSYDPDAKRHIRLTSVNRLYALLKFTNSAAETKQVVRTLNNYAIEHLENRQKFILHKEIQRQVKINSKLIKVGALKKGKFDWKTNTVFSELQQMNRMTLEDAQKEYNRLIDADSAVLGEERESIEQNPTAKIEAPTDFQAILKTKFLEYKSNKVRNLNLAATRSLLEDIMQLKFEGRRAKDADELKKKLSKYNYENDLVSRVRRNSENDLAKYLTRWTAGDTWFTTEGTLANWESMLTHIFDRHTAEKYSLLKTEADVEVYAHRKCQEFYNKAMDIYKLKNTDTSKKGRLKDLWNRALDFDNTQPIISLFQEYEDKNHTYQFRQYTFNKDVNKFVETNIDITHAQLITFYAWSLNPELKKRIMVQFFGEPEDNNYTIQEEQLNQIMFSKLSEQDKEFAHAMIDICDSMYDDTNEVFIRTTGLSLPRVENYIPSKTERIGSDLDMMHENILRSTNPSFIKQRKSCRRIKMEAVSPLEIILPHINKTSRYIVMSEKVNFYNKIFQSPDVKAAILDVYGKKSGTKIYRVLLNQLATSTYENYARAVTVGKDLMDTIASNYITSKIGGNLKVFFSQLTSVINYAENMPTAEWAKGFHEAVRNPRETIEFMFDNCEYLKARLAGNSQNEIISQLTNEADKLRSWRNFSTMNTKYGDVLAIALGGKPYVDYLLKHGTMTDEETGKTRPMTKEEVFNKFVETTLRSQQSGHNSATSAWQKKQSQNALTRMIFAFNNTNLQYERKWIDALGNYAKRDITKQELAKSFVVYKLLNPILFSSFLTNLSILTLIQNLFGGGDDDNPFLTFGADSIASVALSNWKAYGMVGIIANAIVAAVAAKATDGKFFEDGLPLIGDFEYSLKRLLNGKTLDVWDYVEMLVGAGDYATGLSMTRTYNALGGTYDLTQGDFGKGLLRILGYGNYRASVAATGQEPEKK